jgi:hypothetical protein
MDETTDIYELIAKMRDVQGLNDTSIAESHVIKKIDYERIFLVGYGDLHIENLGTDLDRIEMELKIMSRIPNLFVVFMGDLTDSSVKYLNNNFDTYLTPKAAREFGYRIFDALGEKLICALSGCHEKHGEEVADFDYVEEYCKRNDVPFLNERGLLTLELANDRILNVALAHKAQGYSMYNPFHPAIRIVREKYPDADVVITAHQHQSGIAVQNEQDKARAMMTIGSRKQGDRYATRRGFPPQLPNKNLPVLEVIPGGYKIMNDISLLKNLGEREKLEELQGLGFKNAIPVKQHIKGEALEEEIQLRRIMAAGTVMAEGEGKEPKDALNFDLHPTLREGKIITEHNMEVQRREEAAKQAEIDNKKPMTRKEKRAAYMKGYMRRYRKKKREERESEEI